MQYNVQNMQDRSFWEGRAMVGVEIERKSQENLNF